jgi:ATP-dependent exoDNAse (exonuclease V) beta subunit
MIRPGAYDMVDPKTKETYSVVWWDPLLLEGAADDPRGLRRDDLIAKNARPEDVAADRATYDQWRANRSAVQQAGSRPSARVQTVTEWSITDVPGPGIDPAAVAIEEVPGRIDRPSGKRFGTLVHALLASTPLDATSRQVDELAALHATLLAVPVDERDAASRIVTTALAHTRLAGARAAITAGRRVMREAAVSMAVDGTIIDGQVDLAYETAEGWIVVDFKSDIELASGGETYRRQVAFYVAAVAKATGRKTQGIILRV